MSAEQTALRMSGAGYLEPEDMPTEPCIILTGTEAAIKAAAKHLFDHVTVAPVAAHGASNDRRARLISKAPEMAELLQTITAVPGDMLAVASATSKARALLSYINGEGE